MTDAADRIEKNLEHDRAHLRETLGAIEQKMSPGRMLDEAMAYFNTGPRAFAADLTSQIRENPMPALLTGVGIAWMILSDRKTPAADGGSAAAAPTARPDMYNDPGLLAEDYEVWDAHDRLQAAEWACVRLVDETDEAYALRLDETRASALGLNRVESEPHESFRTKVSTAADAVRRKGASARDRFRRLAGSAKHGAQAGREGVVSAVKSGLHGAGSAASSARQWHEANPVATGAIGIAIGALAGAALPLSRKEEQVLGGIADKGLAAGADVSRKAADGLSDALRDHAPSQSRNGPVVM